MCLKRNNETYFFHQKVCQILFIFHECNKFILNCLILQQDLLYIKRKNPCHQQWQENNVNLVYFIAITIFPFWITESEKYYMKNRIFDETIFDINVLKLLSLQHNIRPLFALGLLCFYFKFWTYLTWQQQRKTW